jgi:hypothetical protein
MLRKRFNLLDTHVKSSFEFKIREDPGWRRLPQRGRRTVFRDPVALPVLEKIGAALNARGFRATKPKVGKACHTVFNVAFDDVSIVVILHVRRRRGMVEFSILSWPYQSLTQRWRTRASSNPDFAEWEQLCTSIYDILSGEIKPESLQWMTFKESEATA